MLHRLERISLVQERPALVGVGVGIVGAAGERLVHGRRGCLAVAEFHQGLSPQIRTQRMLGLGGQPLIGDGQRLAPAAGSQMQAGEDRKVVRVIGMQANCLHDCRLSLREAVPPQHDLGQSVLPERVLGGQVNRLLGVMRRLVELLDLRQAQAQQAMRQGILGVVGKLQAQLTDGVGEPTVFEEQRCALEVNVVLHASFRYFRMSSYIPPWLA